jgi:4-hydroxy-3-polyprenylbenzoate decarboxylase
VNTTGKLVVAVTGASGAIYAQRFLRHAVEIYDEIFLMLSAQSVQVAGTELGLSLKKEAIDFDTWLGISTEKAKGRIILCDSKDYYTPPASGSFRHDGMVIVPCSMGTAGRIAHGISDDLVTRSADVCLKEGRKLVLVPREMPWNLIMLRNMTQLVEAGATILPASPAWYTNPTSLEALADTVVARIFQQLDVDSGLQKQWMVDDSE